MARSACARAGLLTALVRATLAALCILLALCTQTTRARATGRVVLGGKGAGKKNGKLKFTYMVKSFFTTLVDPTAYVQGSLLLEGGSTTTHKAKGGKGKKHKLGGQATAPTSSVFGEGGATIGGGSFGPVCGPNGCH